MAGALTLAGSGYASAYEIVNRWTTTQIDGSGLQRGDPVTLRWSVVPDGQSYSRSSDSQLIQYLDDGWNIPEGQRTPDFTNRLWWTVMDTAYQQFGRVSGVSMTYVGEQDADGISTGMVGDVRIGGENIDGSPGGALADNTYPDSGDMRIDITRESNGGPAFWHTDVAAFRNLMIHETGHGVGLGHAHNTGVKSVMEGGLRTDVWGLQFDDVYALNRQYGDPLEQNGGNNLATTATDLGSLNVGGSISIGRDAVDSVVEQFDDDWVGIDGLGDVDWFRVTIADPGFLNAKLTPIGPSYVSEQQGNFNSAAMNDLTLQLFQTTPTTSVISTANETGLGAAEVMAAQWINAPGDYMLRIRGSQDFNQFYQLDLAFNEAPAAGTSADVNLDGVTSLLDWEVFSANAFVDLGDLTNGELFQKGDLDFDGDNDVNDFRLFKTAFNATNGANAFENLLIVPEPSSLAGGLVAAIVVMTRRRRK